MIEKKYTLDELIRIRDKQIELANYYLATASFITGLIELAKKHKESIIVKSIIEEKSPRD